MSEDLSAFQPHPYMLYELTPGWRSEDGSITHNKHGFRGRELLEGHPKRRVFCMGESSTYGYKLIDGYTYPEYLAQLLDAEVINAGVPGYTSAECMIQLIMKILPLTHPEDLILYCFTHNDVHARRFPPEKFKRDYSHFSKHWSNPGWWHRDLNVSTFIRRYDEYKVKPPEWITQNEPIAFKENLKVMAKLKDLKGVSFVVVGPPYTKTIHPVDQAVKQHRELAKYIAYGHTDGWVDLDGRVPYEGVPGAEPWCSSFFYDRVHPNQLGAMSIASNIAKGLAEIGFDWRRDEAVAS